MLQSPYATRAKKERQVYFPCLPAVSLSNLTLSHEGNVVLVKIYPGTGELEAQPDKIKATNEIKNNFNISIFILKLPQFINCRKTLFERILL